MIEVTNRRMECTLLTSNYSQMPAVVLHLVAGFVIEIRYIASWALFLIDLGLAEPTFAHTVDLKLGRNHCALFWIYSTFIIKVHMHTK